MSLMNIDEKTPKILASQIQNHIKEIPHHNQEEGTADTKGGATFKITVMNHIIGWRTKTTVISLHVAKDLKWSNTTSW